MSSLCAILDDTGFDHSINQFKKVERCELTNCPVCGTLSASSENSIVFKVNQDGEYHFDPLFANTKYHSLELINNSQSFHFTSKQPSLNNPQFSILRV
ncbi:MAG: hypothetical protein SFU91_11070 [Chloroherpetonaceae bacterium]|nr:hypothetical protein [Chloroherpetonaceae bacterium]